MPESMQTGVLVIGGGGAATRAALEARLAGADVVLMVKGSFGAIGTRGAGATTSALSEFGVFATPGWTGPLSEAEKPYTRYFAPLQDAFDSIIQVGLGMADPKLSRVLIEEAADSRTALLNWGARFGEYGLRSHGVPIMEALVGQIKKTDITILERTMAVSLLVQDGECCGAIGINEITGDTTIVRSGATIIATGGDANLFMLNLNPSCNTGDGYALGYEAGAELMNLEFKQVFIGTVYPNKNMAIRPFPPYTKLTNAQNEEFLPKYLPQGTSATDCLAQRQKHNPFSSRDTLSRYVDIAIIGEVQAGRGTAHQGIYLDRSDPRNPTVQLRRNEFWQYRGIDFSQPVEVGVCHHSSLGGFKIDENAETSLPRLYAAGEVAAGPHGADRMGGHMLLAAQVFGARAGRQGASSARGHKLPDVHSRTLNDAQEQIDALRNKKGNSRPGQIKKKLQELAYFNLLLVKNEKKLTRFLDDVKNLHQEFSSDLSISGPQDLTEALEVQNLLSLADIEANVCLKRTESRGPHYRDDFPQPDNRNWLKNTIAKNVNGKLQMSTIELHPDWQSKGDEKVQEWG